MTIYNDKVTTEIAQIIAENIVETSLGQYIYVWQFISDLIQNVEGIHLNFEGGNGLREKVMELYEKHKIEEASPNGFFVRFPNSSEKDVLKRQEAYEDFIHSQGRVTDQEIIKEKINKEIK